MELLDPRLIPISRLKSHVMILGGVVQKIRQRVKVLRPPSHFIRQPDIHPALGINECLAPAAILVTDTCSIAAFRTANVRSGRPGTAHRNWEGHDKSKNPTSTRNQRADFRVILRITSLNAITLGTPLPANRSPGTYDARRHIRPCENTRDRGYVKFEIH